MVEPSLSEVSLRQLFRIRCRLFPSGALAVLSGDMGPAAFGQGHSKRSVLGMESFYPQKLHVRRRRNEKAGPAAHHG